VLKFIVLIISCDKLIMLVTGLLSGVGRAYLIFFSNLGCVGSAYFCTSGATKCLILKVNRTLLEANVTSYIVIFIRISLLQNLYFIYPI